MRNWKSMLFAALIFGTLSFCSSVASAQMPEAPALTAEEATLVIRDSDNAHQVAKRSLDAIGCMLTALQGGVDYTAQDCAERLAEDLAGLSQEHYLLHPRIVSLIAGKLAERQS